MAVTVHAAVEAVIRRHMPTSLSDNSMRLEIESIIIEKKAYLGRRDLTEAWVPAHVKRIENWAFAQCDRLRVLELPAGIEYIGRDVFLGCSLLDKVIIYGAEAMEHFSERKALYVSEMTAAQLRHFDGGNAMCFADVGSPKWFLAWDRACARYIESADDRGFMPFLSGGEEDYEEVPHMRQRYEYETQKNKMRIVLRRLRGKDAFPTDEKAHMIWNRFLKRVSADGRRAVEDGNWDRKGSCRGVLMETLTEDSAHLCENFRVCMAEGVFDMDFMQMLIAALPQEQVELRAMLMHEVQRPDMEKSIWKEFRI